MGLFGSKADKLAKRFCELVAENDADQAVEFYETKIAECADEVSRRLVSFVERRLMVAAGERYLSLAVPQGAARAAPRLRPLPASPRVE